MHGLVSSLKNAALAKKRFLKAPWGFVFKWLENLDASP